jgi:hypothetical protein
MWVWVWVGLIKLQVDETAEGAVDPPDELDRSNFVVRLLLGLLGCVGLGRGRPYGEIIALESERDDLRR